MTLDEALEQVAIGGSIAQTIWTKTPEGVEPQDNVEYQVKVLITKTGEDSHRLEQIILGSRLLT